MPVHSITPEAARVYFGAGLWSNNYACKLAKDLTEILPPLLSVSDLTPAVWLAWKRMVANVVL